MAFRRSILPPPSALKMEAVYSSETVVYSQQRLHGATTQKTTNYYQMIPLLKHYGR
jgi:hypothetical protein